MLSSPDLFGTMPDGSPVHRVRLERHGLRIDVITFGAALADIVFADRSVVLGCGTLDDYVAKSPHFGAVLGRCANRIAKGHLDIDGRTFQLALNNGPNHMHGGAPGFSRRNWTLVSHDDSSVTLRLVAQDGEQGYPGRVEATCRYAITDASTFEMTLEATTDRPTIVNLSNHSYFNLSDAATVDGHVVRIAAERHLPLDDENIPTGAIADVAGTRFDFRAPRMLGAERFDTPYVIDMKDVDEPRFVASATASSTGLQLEVFTTKPCVQFYTGQNIRPGVPDRAGRDYVPGAGLCFETQAFPDAPNHASFPGIRLDPGETYRHVTRYRLSRASA